MCCTLLSFRLCCSLLSLDGRILLPYSFQLTGVVQCLPYYSPVDTDTESPAVTQPSSMHHAEARTAVTLFAITSHSCRRHRIQYPYSVVVHQSQVQTPFDYTALNTCVCREHEVVLKRARNAKGKGTVLFVHVMKATASLILKLGSRWIVGG